MEFDPQLRHSVVPLSDTIDSEIDKIADENITKDLAGAATNSGVLYCVVDVTDDTDSLRGSNDYFFCCRELV